ncbi:MAG: TonB-dependent receptor [Cyclobacteriaceae bacterium]
MRLWFIILFLVFSASTWTFSQNTFKAVVKDAETLEPLAGASGAVQGTAIGSVADDHGVIQIDNVPDGVHNIEFSFVGYLTRALTVVFPEDSQKASEIFLPPAGEALDEIIISSTRSSRTIADIPTRVEYIAGEELEEKGNMKPGDIRMLLNESTGIQTQQTSATSANASIRIQGLDGRYTEILKDGFPLYAGFSGGLGLLQTPPLDLKQVEVIKGATSTLYGGGAIAGLVNLISRVPDEERDLRFLINGTSAGGLDISGFFGQKYGKAGLTLFTSRNSNEPYDPADIGLTAIPKFERYTVNPKLFLDFSESTSLIVGFNFITEDRIGGDVKFIEGDGDAIHRYFENNESQRFSTQFSFSHRLTSQSSLNLKNSFNRFDRIIELPSYRFEGIQRGSFTELNCVTITDRSEWIGGLNLWTDEFSDEWLTISPIRSYRQTTLGAFIQNTFKFSDKVALESGMRGDYVLDYGFVLLPRISLLYEAGPFFSSRIGGGFGYKAPTIFTEESERIQYQNVLPITVDKNKLEKSYGANWDLNYRTELGDKITLSINHLFFYTYLNDPLSLSRDVNGMYEFLNLPGFIDTRGIETNIKIEYEEFKLFTGYTFTDTKIHYAGTSVQSPLTAKHRLNNVLMYEVEEKWKVGLEAYYFSRQRLNDNTYGEDYLICGLMIEKIWKQFSLFLNFENFLDARQTRFDTIYTGTISDPVFRDVYAPVDGFVVNGGLKLDL